MAYDPYQEQGKRRAIQTVGIEAPSDVRGAMAVAGAMGDIGQGIGQIGNAIEMRNELLADTDARKAFEARTAARNDYFYKPEEGLMNQRGANGVNIRDGGRAGLGRIDDQFRPTDPQAARDYDRRVSAARLEENAAIDKHSSQQTEKYILEGREASVNTAVENAVLNYTNPELFDKHVNEAVSEQRGMDQLLGTSPEEMAARERNIRSGAAKARVLRVAVEDPLAAKALLEQDRGSMSPDAQQSLDTALEGPVTQAQANAALAPFIGTPDTVRPNAERRVLPRRDYPTSGDATRDGIIETAQAIGADPFDLATAISFETGGTFDPLQPGPTTQHGQHRGFIQFGEPQAREAGVDFSSRERALATQLGANGGIAKYFRSRGFKPGMSGLDLYSTINAGSPGRYKASDANNGGTPGNVADKWNDQMGGHRQNAAKLLGIEGAYSSADRRAPGQAALNAAGIAPTPLGEYVVNHAGLDSGIAIMKALQERPGALMKTVAPDFEGDPLTTVAQYADRATRDMGADLKSQQGGYIDTQAALAAAMREPNPKVRDAMISQIGRFDALNNQAKDAAASAAYDQAWTDWKMTGNTQIPLDTQLAMGPGKLASLQSTIAGEETGSLVTDMDVYEGLMAATADPARMAAVDLRDYRGSLTTNDYRFFTAQQASATSALTATGKATEIAAEKARYIDHEASWGEVKDIFEATGLVLDGKSESAETRQRLVRARQQMSEQLLAFVETNGRAPTLLEKRGIAGEMAAPAILGGASGNAFQSLFGGGAKGQLWETEYAKPGTTVKVKPKITDIPVDLRLQIGAEIEEAGGEVTPEAVVDEYARRTVASQGLPVATATEDVPQWAKDKMRAKGIPEAQMVTQYNGFMAKQYGR